ncbi:MAG: hypothetical protein J5999_10995 [Oscillospiraceae bacterium]|nr:hypothetical protein [Oscillospiraceae bacterium]
MKFKRIFSIITAVAMCAGLCGCQPKNSGQSAEEGTVLETVLSYKEDSSEGETVLETAVSDTVSSEISETTSAETEPVSVNMQVGDIAFSRPDKDFIRTAAEKRDGYYLTLRLNDDGSFSVLNDDETDNALYGNNDYEYLKEMLTEENYKELAEAGILDELGIDSYEKYAEFVLDAYGYDSIEDAKKGGKPALYFVIGQSNEWDSLVEGNAELLTEAAEQLFVKLEENPDIAKSASKALESGKSYACVASVTDMGGGIIELEMGFADMETCRNADSPEEADYYFKDKLSVDGTDGFSFGEFFVPADTEYLCISSRDEATFKMLTSDLNFPENAVICAAVKDDNYHSYDISFDLKWLSENLPNLKGLYMYQAEIENPEYLTELSALEELSYYPSVTDEDGYISADNGYLPDFGKLTKLKKLYIFGNYEDYGFLKNLGNVDSISVKVEQVERSQLEDIFACPNVTELEVYGWASDDLPDFSGIEALKNLRRLDITISKLDFAQIAEASSLEEFSVRVYNGGQNAEQLGKLKNVRVMKLDGVECDDFGFLTEMTSLRDLTISSMTGIRNSDVEKLTNLEKLSLANETAVDVRVIEKLPNLKTFFWDGSSQWVDISDVKGSQSLESFGQLFGSIESYEFFGNCPNLRTVTLLGVNGVPLDMSIFVGTKVETIDCNGTKFENLKALADVKTLKSLSVSGILEEDEDIIYLKSALPDCEIYCGEQAFTNTVD